MGEKGPVHCTSLAYFLKKCPILLICSASREHGRFKKELSTDHPCVSIPKNQRKTTKLNLLYQHRAAPKQPTYEVIHLLHALNSSDDFCERFLFATLWFGWVTLSKLRNITSSKKILEKHGPNQAGFDSSGGLGVSRITVILTLLCHSVKDEDSRKGLSKKIKKLPSNKLHEFRFIYRAVSCDKEKINLS